MDLRMADFASTAATGNEQGQVAEPKVRGAERPKQLSSFEWAAVKNRTPTGNGLRWRGTDQTSAGTAKWRAPTATSGRMTARTACDAFHIGSGSACACTVIGKAASSNPEKMLTKAASAAGDQPMSELTVFVPVIKLWNISAAARGFRCLRSRQATTSCNRTRTGPFREPTASPKARIYYTAA